MKKLLTFLVSVCLVCALIVPAHAAGSVSLRISASSSTVSRGDTVTFTVTISGSGDITSYGLDLSYDTSVFEMVGGSCTVSGAALSDFTPGSGFVVAYRDPTTPSGTVGTFTLRVKDSAAFGTYSVGGSAAAKSGSDSVSASASGASVTVVCSHSYGSWSQTDGDTHGRTCTICGEPQSAAHNWDGGKTTKPADCQTTGELLRTCPDCGATKTEPIPLGEHKYGSWTKVDDSKHTHTCYVCQKEETLSHSWNGGTTVKPANCITDGEVRYTCTGCGTTRTETVRQTGVHTYDHGCDTDCNVCGATRTTSHDFSGDWFSDKNGHWHTCANCGEKEPAAAHTPGPEPTDDDPQTCTVCAYVLKPSLRHEHVYDDKLTADETGHWYPCAQCADQKDFAPHAFDNDCDETCDTCRYKRQIQHKWSDTWAGDEAAHYYACTVCGEKKDAAAHDFRRGVCTVCSAADPNYEPFTLPFWVWLLIGFAAGSGLTALLFVLLGKRRKENEPPKPPKTKPEKKEPEKKEPVKAAPEKTEPAAPVRAAAVTQPTPVKAAPVKPTPVKTVSGPTPVEVVSADALRASGEKKAAPAKAAPMKAEPVKAAPVKAEPVKAEPVKTEPVKVEPVKTEPVKAEPVKAEPVKVESVKVESVKAETLKAETLKAEPVKPAPRPIGRKLTAAEALGLSGAAVAAASAAKPAEAAPKTEPVKVEVPKAEPVTPAPKISPVGPKPAEAAPKAEPVKAEIPKAEPVKVEVPKAEPVTPAPRAAATGPNPMGRRKSSVSPLSPKPMMRMAVEETDDPEPLVKRPMTPPPAPKTPEQKESAPQSSDAESEVQIRSTWKPF